MQDNEIKGQQPNASRDPPQTAKMDIQRTHWAQSGATFPHLFISF
jgi:hypothetical protein